MVRSSPAPRSSAMALATTCLTEPTASASPCWVTSATNPRPPPTDDKRRRCAATRWRTLPKASSSAISEEVHQDASQLSRDDADQCHVVGQRPLEAAPVAVQDRGRSRGLPLGRRALPP